jgi:hypothetical protein
MRTITKLYFDCHPYMENGTVGQWHTVAEVGHHLDGESKSPKVISIEEHRSAGEGDKWYYDIFLEDGSMQRTFNPNRAFYAPEKFRA